MINKRINMNAIETLNRMPQIGVGNVRYVGLDDARFIIEQIVQEYEAKSDGKLKSAEAIKSFIEGVLYSREKENPEDPTLIVLRDILMFITC